MDLVSPPWTIEFRSGIPAYKQIVHQVQTAIADGRLRAGDQLPTIRALHEQLNLNPNTIAKAYRELELGGFLTTQRGTGCFVAAPSPPPRLSPKDRKAKIDELSARFAAEARSHGIPFEELLHDLQTKSSHVPSR